jgi:hypothetical protein
MIDQVKKEQFLYTLDAIDQEKQKTATKSFDCDSSEFYWIFKNLDYNQWISANNSQLLWLSGPPECRVRNAVAHIVDVVNEASDVQRSVLYFFCSSATAAEPVSITFVCALVLQIVQYIPSHNTLVITTFLRTLLDAILSREHIQARFRGDDSPITMVQKVLDASSNEYCDALTAVLRIDIAQELFLIIDGLDKIERQKVDFMKNVLTMIENLQESSLTVKAMLTGRSYVENEGVFNGLPYIAIEYDRERKG